MILPKACVIGWPVRHSRSPLIHRYWLKQLGIAGDYEKLEISPERLAQFIENLPASAYVGCNVTIPHKEAAFHQVRVDDEQTRKLGVVNTLFVRSGTVLGTSTDGDGFVHSLHAGSPGFSPAGKHIVVLGAGGAARAITGKLVDCGAGEIVIVNRSPGKAHSLQRDFGKTIKVMEWTKRSDIIAETDVLVNATSLGMKGQPELDIELSSLPNHAIVTDIVYVPLETALLKRARAQGNAVVPGLGMLLHQAVGGFELWFGVRPKVTPELHDLVAADIERTA